MDVQVAGDAPEVPPATPLPLAVADRDAPGVRRFEIDPASSPMLLAALAWTAAPRR